MLAENLKFFREKKGWGRGKLAKTAGVSMRTIEFIEKEKVLDPKITTLERLAKALDVTVNALIE